MLHATELLGGEAYDVHGNFVGRVRELFIEPADQPNRVARFLLGRGKYLPAGRPLRPRSLRGARSIKLNVEEKALEHYQPNEGWLAVRKDLLDQQIIDTRGRKVVRVNDMDLTEHRTNGTVELRVSPRGRRASPARSGACCRALASPCADPAHPGQASDARMIRWEFVNLDRARSAAAREAAHHASEAGEHASCRPGRHHGRSVARRAAGHHRFARRSKPPPKRWPNSIRA